jgi:hypothetical protein
MQNEEAPMPAATLLDEFRLLPSAFSCVPGSGALPDARTNFIYDLPSTIDDLRRRERSASKS